MRIIRKLLIIILCLFSYPVYGTENKDSIQSYDSQSNKFAEYFIDCFNNQKKDSINALFKKWENTFGLSEPLQRAKIIYHLYFNTFNDSILGDSIACNIILFLDRKHNDYLNNEAYFSFVPIHGSFDRFTDSIAKIVINKYNKKSVEYLLSELYSNRSDSILIKINRPAYKKSKIHNSPCLPSKKIGSPIKNYKTIDLAAIAGLWIPTGKLSLLGIHPQLGFQTGVNKLNYSMKFTFLIRFLNSPNSFSAARVKSNNSVEETKMFFGPYVGLDCSKNIKNINQSTFTALVGLGFDAFQVLKENEKLNYYSEDARTYNLNFGFGYRYYFKNLKYVGFEAKYNIVDYTLRKSINLTGDFISLIFIYGFVEKLN